MKINLFISVLFLIVFNPSVYAGSWPEKSYTSFFKSVGLKKYDDETNWSGGHWNPVTKTLYLCRNDWGIRSFKYTRNNKFVLDLNLEFKPSKSYDFESITQSDLNSQVVWLINENENLLEEYDLSKKPVARLSQWNLKKIVKGKKSFEGLVFVPNKLLKKFKFTDGEGRPYLESKYKRNGIFLISDQNSGLLYALDLNLNGKIDLVGSYKIPLKSTRALDLDYTSGLLFALDGKKLVTFSLESEIDQSEEADRAFKIKNEFNSPGPNSVEGMAVISELDKDKIILIITDDENLSAEAVKSYKINKGVLLK